MSHDVVPAGQEDHPALADPELRDLIDRPGPDALARVTVLAAELVARHTGAGEHPPVAEALTTLRAGLALGAPPAPRPGLVADLEALTTTLRERLSGLPTPAGEPGPSPAERVLSQVNAVRAIGGALDADPVSAAWNVCWLSGNAVGRNFGDQLTLVVLDRCRDRAVRVRPA
jgi:hypothetical protein